MPGSETPRAVGNPTEAAQFVVDCLRIPLSQARQLVKDGVQSGEIPAVVVGFSDRREPATAAELTDDWLGLDDDAASARTLIIEDPEGPALVLAFARPALEVSFLAAERFARAMLGKSPATPNVAPKDRGGRPTEYDWRRATRHVLCRVQEYGWPASRAELVNELLDWFARNYAEPPDTRTVEKFVAAIWPQGRCELEPRE